jgi:hypothetical protein
MGNFMAQLLPPVRVRFETGERRIPAGRVLVARPGVRESLVRDEHLRAGAGRRRSMVTSASAGTRAFQTSQVHEERSRRGIDLATDALCV